MKQESINRAYSSLLKLKDYKLPLKKAYAIYKLYTAISESYEFALGEEQKYMMEYKGKPNGDGTVTFATPTDCAAFRDKVEELNNMDVDVNVEAVAISERDLGEQAITPSDIANLEGFVTFE